MKQQSYYSKITRFISALIIFSYVVMLLISSIAYAYIKISSYNSTKNSQLDYYDKTLNNIASAVNTNINFLYNSGAIHLCQINSFLNPPEKIEARFNDALSFLKTTNNNNIFNSFYLIGNLSSNYSLFYSNESHNLEYMNLYYSFIYKGIDNNFIKHYENIFKFNKEDMNDLAVPDEL